MIIQMNLINDLGSFDSEKMTVNPEEYMALIEVSKKFYLDDNGLEMWLENGFMVVPPNIARNSILKIIIIEE